MMQICARMPGVCMFNFSQLTLLSARPPKVRSYLEHSSFKIMVIFNITSADFILISADVILKMTTILEELRIAQPCSKNGRTLA
jgi:hypothetical protein